MRLLRQAPQHGLNGSIIMANTFFKFKQFIVQQDTSAMKVCTDSCLFGAWVAEQFKNKDIQNVLDIGSGTGLLSLMLAQKMSARFDAVEINDGAYNQTKNNFNSSRWKERLNTYHEDIRQFKSAHKYDMVICNPPFYQRSLMSPHKNINEARHDVSLLPNDLLYCVQNLMTRAGYFAVLLPYYITDKFIRSANQHDLFLEYLIKVKNSADAAYIRSMAIFSRANKTVASNDIAIKNGNGYTEAFKVFLKDYYLAL